jgi:hypothetical protein
MKKVYSTIFLTALFVVYSSLFIVCYGQTVASTELINNAKIYDGKLVVYAGEVIGDVMQRGDYAWVNVNDGENAVGIWINTNLAKEINYSGSYKSKGDRIEITGTFQRACPEHGGDLDIHAQALRKISAGRQVEERLNPAKKNLAIILLVMLGVIWILTLLKRR